MAVAIVAFRALTSLQVRSSQFTDISGGRLTMPDGRMIPAPSRDRLALRLGRRIAEWPSTWNPHLLVTKQTGPRLNAPGRRFPRKETGMSAGDLRKDRILAEIRATGSDPRRLTDPFGLSLEGTHRYVDTLEQPDASRNAPDAWSAAAQSVG